MSHIDRDKASLVVVGSGIKFMSHLTVEAKVHIESADKVLYLINEPATQEWINTHHDNAESLDSLYQKYPLRIQCYREITKYILTNLKKQQHVCVAMYGHPTVFAQPALDAVIQAKKEGYYATVLPGISAVDCLFADLLIDFGIRGCQLIEATDLLVNHRIPDIHGHLVLWQPGVIGMLGHAEQHDNSQGVKVLKEYLKEFYVQDHELVLYEAAQYPSFDPRIERFPLNKLDQVKLTRISTLYVPPQGESKIDEKMLNTLGIDIEDLQ